MTRDQEARARIETDLDRSFLVEAAAGTGKTTALVGRLVRLVATGRARITEVAAITFTERASGELVLRLREKLELARQACTDASERERLDDALADFEAAYVGTIHGFCAEILRARPLDAGVDPTFTMLGDDEQSALLDETSGRFLEAALADPPEGIRRALARPSDWEPLPPRARFAREIKDLAEHRDQDPRLRRDPFDRDAEIDALLERLRSLSELKPEGGTQGDGLARLLADLGEYLLDVAELERTRPRDYDVLERQLIAIVRPKNLDWTATGRGKQLGTRVRADVLAARDSLREALEAFHVRADADLAFCLARDLAPAVRDYEARKRALGVLDHLDALLRTRELLVASRLARVALRERFRFLFVDEVQDVDPVQKDIVLLLAGSDPDESDPARVAPRPGSLYLVGDPKQAIYGFRRADLRTYLALKAALVPAHAETLELGASFRPRPAIAALVNQAFESVFDGQNGQPSHVALEAQREPMSDFPSVIALPSPRASIWKGSITRSSVDGAMPEAIASFVHWLLNESGLSVEDPSTRVLVPIAPRHVGILFKTLKTNGTRVARSLERFGVPHAFVAPEAFFEREVVVAASALLSAIEWPDDSLAVYATLRGPLVGVPDADLLAYRESIGPLHPLSKTSALGQSKDAQVIHAALALLGELHRERHVRAIEATLGLFLERCETDVLLVLTEQRGEARALEQLRQIARRADVRGTTFRDLARWLAERVDEPEVGAIDVAQDPEEDDAVSLLTVHRAKGLEFPVVVIADPTTRPLRVRGAGRYTDPAKQSSVRELAGFAPVELRESLETASALERAEASRLLYVAATRARDVLVVPTVGFGEIEDSWMAPLARALVPADPRAAVTTFPRLPTFGDRSMLDDRDDPGVRPGHHASHLGGVTYWDPQHVLRPAPPRDPRGHTHLVEKVDGRSALAEESAHESERTRTIDDASLGALDVISSRRAARTPIGATLGRVDVTLVELGAATADGARFERLVRELIAEPDLASVAEVRGRALGATIEERTAAIELATRFRAHPTFAPWLAAPDLRVEVPFVLATDAGPVVWGRVPLAVSSGTETTIFGIAAGATVDAAKTELSIAASALEKARNHPVRAYLACAR